MKLVTINHMTLPLIETFYERSSIGHTFKDLGSFIKTAKTQNYLFRIDDIELLQIFKVNEVIAQ